MPRVFVAEDCIVPPDNGRLPLEFTPNVSRVWDWEFGGEISFTAARFALCGVAGLFGSASSGNISSSEALRGEECMVESPSRSDGGVSSMRGRLDSILVGVDRVKLTRHFGEYFGLASRL